MKPTNSIYIGDRQLDPDDEPEPIFKRCQSCFGLGYIDGLITRLQHDCPDCKGSGQIELTESERRQKAFDDFDPPDCGDFGEPL